MTKQLAGLFFAGYRRLCNRDESAQELLGGVAKMSKGDVATFMCGQNREIV